MFEYVKGKFNEYELIIVLKDSTVKTHKFDSWCGTDKIKEITEQYRFNSDVAYIEFYGVARRKIDISYL